MTSKRNTVKAMMLTIAVGAAVIGGGAAATAGGKPGSDKFNPPPRPPWMMEDGTVDLGKFPADGIGVVDERGKDVKDENGKEVKLKAKDLFAPPPPPGQAKQEDKPTDKRKTYVDENGTLVEVLESNDSGTGFKQGKQPAQSN